MGAVTTPQRHSASRSRNASRIGGVFGLVGVIATTISLSGTAADATDNSTTPAVQYPVTGNLVQAVTMSLPNPAASPAGVNVPNCHPSAAHPRPVVLEGGTFSNMIGALSGLGPTLANQGYCVYSTAFGADPNLLIQGFGSMSSSLATIAAFIDQVRASTGSPTVDYVGWSQGGMLGELYLKFVPGGASKVSNYVGIAPPTHGTTFNGLATLAQLIPIVNVGIGFFCPGCVEQQAGSSIVNALSYGAIAQPQVKYTVIETFWEDVVTPIGSSFINEPGVTNQWLQNSCPYSISDHILMLYDRGVWGLVANALDPAHQVKVSC